MDEMTQTVLEQVKARIRGLKRGLERDQKEVDDSCRLIGVLEAVVAKVEAVGQPVNARALLAATTGPSPFLASVTGRRVDEPEDLRAAFDLDGTPVQAGSSQVITGEAAAMVASAIERSGYR